MVHEVKYDNGEIHMITLLLEEVDRKFFQVTHLEFCYVSESRCLKTVYLYLKRIETYFSQKSGEVYI